jgi:hypothetical protein
VNLISEQHGVQLLTEAKPDGRFLVIDLGNEHRPSCLLYEGLARARAQAVYDDAVRGWEAAADIERNLYRDCAWNAPSQADEAAEYYTEREPEPEDDDQ